ncbi:MAG: patatin-like phospholipase family protein [Pseudomonadales bacterium]
MRLTVSLFTVQAGAQAYAQIRREGLRVQDVAAVFGASGAAKWLAISGLDKAIFGRWLADAPQRILLFGTSVGAFKLAAAAQRNPVEALDRLAEAYIEQRYPDGLSLDAIDLQIKLILEQTMPQAELAGIIDNPRYLFSCGATACSGLLGNDQAVPQSLGMLATALRELSPRVLGLEAGLKRVIFCVDAARPLLQGSGSELVTLDAQALTPAIIASGSLPVYMRGVRGLHAHTLRDGGLLDYHPVPANILGAGSGLVLYPHFYTHLVERWFDKFYPWRKVAPARLDNVVLISPSREFCASLELGRLPDRGDFKRFEKRDDERMRLWRAARLRSEELGEQFLERAASGEIAGDVRPLGSDH